MASHTTSLTHRISPVSQRTLPSNTTSMVMTHVLLRLMASFSIGLMALLLLSQLIGRGLHSYLLAVFATTMDRSAETHLIIYDRDLPVTLAQNVYSYGGLAWSPNGRHLAYSADNCDGICIFDFEAGKIFTIGDLGSDLRGTNLAWSNDGRFAFLSDTESPGTQYVVIGSLSGEMQRYQLVIALQNNLLIWSLDGQYLAMTARVADNDADIYLMDTLTGEMINATPYPTNEMFPVWSPHGEMFYTSQQAGAANLFSYNPMTGETRSIIDLEEQVGRYPMLMTEGKLYLARWHDSGLEVEILDIDSNEVVRIPLGYNFMLSAPSLTIDAQRLALTAAGDLGEINICVVNLATGELKEITMQDMRAYLPIWSP